VQYSTDKSLLPLVPTIANIGSEVLYYVDIGFFDGDAKLPKELEVEALLSELDKFIEKQLQAALLNEALEAEVMLVEWAYRDGADMPVGIAFVVEAFSEKETVPQNAIYDALKLDEPSVKDLIQNYIWKVEPSDSVFHKTSTVTFKAKFGIPAPLHGHRTPITGELSLCAFVVHSFLHCLN
jgi:hypothetical protein